MDAVDAWADGGWNEMGLLVFSCTGPKRRNAEVRNMAIWRLSFWRRLGTTDTDTDDAADTDFLDGNNESVFMAPLPREERFCFLFCHWGMLSRPMSRLVVLVAVVALLVVRVVIYLAFALG